MCDLPYSQNNENVKRIETEDVSDFAEYERRFKKQHRHLKTKYQQKPQNQQDQQQQQHNNCKNHNVFTHCCCNCRDQHNGSEDALRLLKIRGSQNPCVSSAANKCSLKNMQPLKKKNSERNSHNLRKIICSQIEAQEAINENGNIACAVPKTSKTPMPSKMTAPCHCCEHTRLTRNNVADHRRCVKGIEAKLVKSHLKMQEQQQQWQQQRKQMKEEFVFKKSKICKNCNLQIDGSDSDSLLYGNRKRGTLIPPLSSSSSVLFSVSGDDKKNYKYNLRKESTDFLKVLYQHRQNQKMLSNADDRQYAVPLDDRKSVFQLRSQNVSVSSTANTDISVKSVRSLKIQSRIIGSQLESAGIVHEDLKPLDSYSEVHKQAENASSVDKNSTKKKNRQESETVAISELFVPRHSSNQLDLTHCGEDEIKTKDNGACQSKSKQYPEHRPTDLNTPLKQLKHKRKSKNKQHKQQQRKNEAFALTESHANDFDYFYRSHCCMQCRNLLNVDADRLLNENELISRSNSHNSSSSQSVYTDDKKNDKNEFREESLGFVNATRLYRGGDIIYNTDFSKKCTKLQVPHNFNEQNVCLSSLVSNKSLNICRSPQMVVNRSVNELQQIVYSQIEFQEAFNENLKSDEPQVTSTDEQDSKKSAIQSISELLSPCHCYDKLRLAYHDKIADTMKLKIDNYNKAADMTMPTEEELTNKVVNPLVEKLENLCSYNIIQEKQLIKEIEKLPHKIISLCSLDTCRNK